jgi:hypothetical protein
VAQLVHAEIRSAGNIGSITAKCVVDSLIFAGVKDSVTALPTSAEDFVDTDAAKLPGIGKVTIRGLAVGTSPALVNSSVAAGFIAAVTLPKRESAVGDTDELDLPFGFAVRTEANSRYAGPASAGDFVCGTDSLIA